MKNLKKLLSVLVLVILVGGLASCTKTNEITEYFEDQGYVRYTYNNKGDSLVFRVHDALFQEELAAQEVDGGDATEPADGEDVVTSDVTAMYFGFTSYVFSNDDFAVVMMEFESEDLLLNKLENSTVLSEYFDGLDAADYINGNCLLIVLDDYADEYDYFVDIFQGRLEAIVTE